MLSYRPTVELAMIGDYESASWGKALYFFDGTTGAQLRNVPVSGWIGGLACVAPATEIER